MKKKIIAAALAISMMTTLAIGMTLAYFTDTQTADNTFTVGNVKIELTEPGWESSGRLDAPTVYAGEALAKDPTVKNTGANPCFVRIKVDGLNSLGANLPITYRTNYETDKLGTNWELHNGYFYYHGVLEVGQTTDALFDQIVMPTGLTNGDNSNKDVTVSAQAVQAQGAMPKFSDVTAMDVTAIAAWFATCGL